MREPEDTKRLRQMFRTLRAHPHVHVVWGIQRCCDKLFELHWLADHERVAITRIAAKAVR